jgi:hypothetical protein
MNDEKRDEKSIIHFTSYLEHSEFRHIHGEGENLIKLT